MVEILLSEGVFQYGVSIRSCGVHNSNCSDVASVSVLIAVVGVQAMSKSLYLIIIVLVVINVKIQFYPPGVKPTKIFFF